MKKFLSIMLLATAGVAQGAYSNEPVSLPPTVKAAASPFDHLDHNAADPTQLASAYFYPECPEGMGWTDVGHCQPYWDFD